MSFIKKALGLIGEVTGISSVGDVLTAIKGNPELEKKLADLELEEANNVRELFKAEVQQEDKFVKRARPALLWLVAGIITMNFVLLPLANTIAGYFGYIPITLTFPALPEPVYWLIGSIFGFYTGGRTYEKVKGKN